MDFPVLEAEEHSSSVRLASVPHQLTAQQILHGLGVDPIGTSPGGHVDPFAAEIGFNLCGCLHGATRFVVVLGLSW